MEGRAWAVAYGAEGVPMLEPKIVRQIEELSAQGWGSRRIANELGVARNTVRCYLHGGEAAQQQALCRQQLAQTPTSTNARDQRCRGRQSWISGS